MGGEEGFWKDCLAIVECSELLTIKTIKLSLSWNCYNGDANYGTYGQK